MSVTPTSKKPSSAFMNKQFKFPTAPDLFGMEAQTTPSGHKRLSRNERVNQSIEAAAAAAENTNPQLAKCLVACKPVVNAVIKGVLVLVPIYEYLFKWCMFLYYQLPKNALLVIFGLALCFFGGKYLMVFAAIEGFRKMGWERAWEDIKILLAAWKEVEQASLLDDDQDHDGDGIADVDQIPPDELFKRKTRVAMMAIKEPFHVQSAVGSLWSAYLAVLATLKLQFAQTTAIALGIAEMIKFPIVRAAAPALAKLLGNDLSHWAETILTTTINFIVILFAWYLQMIISAFYSGLRGGKYVSDGLFALLEQYGIMEKAPDWLVKKPYNPDESYLDEIVMYTFFVGGFVYQLSNNFAVPFPVNLVLLPVWVVEQVLRWQVTFGAIP